VASVSDGLRASVEEEEGTERADEMVVEADAGDVLTTMEVPWV
jgi:hypothetical protein